MGVIWSVNAHQENSMTIRTLYSNEAIVEWCLLTHFSILVDPLRLENWSTCIAVRAFRRTDIRYLRNGTLSPLRNEMKAEFWYNRNRRPLYEKKAKTNLLVVAFEPIHKEALMWLLPNLPRVNAGRLLAAMNWLTKKKNSLCISLYVLKSSSIHIVFTVAYRWKNPGLNLKKSHKLDLKASVVKRGKKCTGYLSQTNEWTVRRIDTFFEIYVYIRLYPFLVLHL